MNWHLWPFALLPWQFFSSALDTKKLEPEERWTVGAERQGPENYLSRKANVTGAADAPAIIT